MTARTRSLAVSFVVVAASVGVAPALAGSSIPQTTTAQNHHAATRDAAGLLRHLHLPAGATQSVNEPAGDSGLLKNPPSYPATPNLVDQRQWWTSSESPSQVIGYVKANAPRGGNQNFSGSRGQCTPHTFPPSGCHTVASFLGFSFHSIHGVLGLRWLIVEVRRLQDGSTGIRVDAEVVWISSRPASEEVPSGVRTIDVMKAFPGQHPSVSKTVTSRGQVRKIIRLIDQLPITQPGASSCPAESSVPIDTFTFRSATNGSPLAVASVRSDADNSTTSCYPMSFTVNGHSEPSLGGARSFLKTVGRLLGVSLTTRP